MRNRVSLSFQPGFTSSDHALLQLQPEILLDKMVVCIGQRRTSGAMAKQLFSRLKRLHPLQLILPLRFMLPSSNTLGESMLRFNKPKPLEELSRRSPPPLLLHAG